MNDQRDPPVLCIDIDRWLKVYPLETTGQTKGGEDWTRSNDSESVVNRPVKQITDSNNDRSSNWKSNRRVDEIMLDRLDLNRVQFVFREFLLNPFVGKIDLTIISIVVYRFTNTVSLSLPRDPSRFLARINSETVIGCR